MTTFSRRDLLECGALALLGLCLGRGALAETRDGRPRRWAMGVDLRACRAQEGCQRCRERCHQRHNVPSLPEARHEVKWIWKEDFEHVFPEAVHPLLPQAERLLPVPVLCNHCADPPCVRVCPTGATFQRPDGIVAMDEHRCIGCRYCMAACPFGARSFNFRDPRAHLSSVNPSYPTRTRGVVEKCNFCVERLAKGLLPHCVDACPAGALRFGDLRDPEFAALFSSTTILRRRPELGTSPHVFYHL